MVSRNLELFFLLQCLKAIDRVHLSQQNQFSMSTSLQNREFISQNFVLRILFSLYLPPDRTYSHIFLLVYRCKIKILFKVEIQLLEIQLYRILIKLFFLLLKFFCLVLQRNRVSHFLDHRPTTDCQNLKKKCLNLIPFCNFRIFILAIRSTTTLHRSLSAFIFIEVAALDFRRPVLRAYILRHHFSPFLFKDLKNVSE